MALRLVVPVVSNAIMGIKSGAVGADGFSIKSIRIVLSHIRQISLIYLISLLPPLVFLRLGRLQLFSPFHKYGAPSGLVDFRPISILCSKFVE
jgi:hypothetical protein